MFLRYCIWPFLLVLASTAQAQDAAAPPSRRIHGFPQGHADRPRGRDGPRRRVRGLDRQPGPDVGADQRDHPACRGEGTAPIGPRSPLRSMPASTAVTSRPSRPLPAASPTPTASRPAMRIRASTRSPRSRWCCCRARSSAPSRRCRAGWSTPRRDRAKAYVLPQGETTITLQSSVTERIQIGKDVFDVWHFELIWAVPGTSNRALNHLHQGRRADPLQRARAGPRRGARGRRGVHFANPGLFEPRRRSGDDPGHRLQPRCNADAAARRRRRARIPVVILLGGSGSNNRDGAVQACRRCAPGRRDRQGRLPGGALRQTRLRSERRAGRIGGVDRLRGRRPRGGHVAGDRKDVDTKRIAVVGHGEGAWVALLAAPAREASWPRSRRSAGPAH